MRHSKLHLKWVLGASILMVVLIGCGRNVRPNGINTVNSDNYESLITRYRNQLKKSPDSVRLRNQLGYVYLKNGQIDNSIQEFENVLQKQPGDPHAVYYLGLAYLNRKELNKAMRIWQRYRDRTLPEVNVEINRLLTILQIASGQEQANEALQNEKNLITTVTDNDTVAVSYYQDLSPDGSLRAYQKGLTAMVISYLTKVDALKVVERVRLQTLLNEIELGRAAIVDINTAPRVGRLLGADSVVVGNLALGSINATTSFFSVKLNQIIGSSAISVNPERFFDLATKIVETIAQIKGISLSAKEQMEIKTPHTTNLQAFVFYGQALDAFDAGDWKKAKNLFDRATELDPDFELATNGSLACPSFTSLSFTGIGQMTIPQIAVHLEAELGPQIAASLFGQTAGSLAPDTSLIKEITGLSGAELAGSSLIVIYIFEMLLNAMDGGSTSSAHH